MKQSSRLREETLKYIHEEENWTNFEWDEEAISESVSEVNNCRRNLNEKTKKLGFKDTSDNTLSMDVLAREIVHSFGIEGTRLNMDEVRSSIASKLGVPIPNKKTPGKYAQKVVDMTLDAMKTESLTEKRLFEWHKMLFSKNQSDCKTMSDDKTIIDGKIIKVGAYRDDEEGVMQVVSTDGRGTEKVHYQAPAASRLEKEMDLSSTG